MDKHLGSAYKYESLEITDEGETVEEVYKKLEVDLQEYLDLERKAHPVESGETPF